MEKRIGTVLILVEDKESINHLNNIIANFSDIILGRQGIPLKEKGISIISLIIESETGRISSLSGQLGKLNGIRTKSVLIR